MNAQRRDASGVGELQQHLVEGGETIDAGELAAGVFGPSTEAAVRDWQARHVGPDGHALTIDGVVGPATAWSLEHPGGASAGYVAPGWRCSPLDAPAAVRPVLQAALAELGVCEQPDGSNSGPRVDVYTAPERGIPWCAAFVSWCYAHAEGGSPFGRFTGSWQFYEWGQAHGRLLAPSDAALPGDVAVILRGDPRQRPHGHTMLVAGVMDDGRIATVEGNSGNAVRGLVRARSALTAIVRPFPQR